jgi:hypothetical protein
MAYELNILSWHGAPTEDLVARVDGAIEEHGVWEQFVELRMASGPTVSISPADEDAYGVSIRWGCQRAEAQSPTLAAAIEYIDRLAQTFYDARENGLLTD